MELYLGSIIEPIRKSIRNTLYFNSKHAPKALGEAMQKAQDLHIKHLYAIGEDQDSVANSSDGPHEKTEGGTETNVIFENICKTSEKCHRKGGSTLRK